MHSRKHVEAELDRIIAEASIDQKALRDEAGCSDDSPVAQCLLAIQAAMDATITRHERDGDVEYLLMASGGGAWRAHKETSRRVFVREVMRRMHALGLDISVVVA